VREFQPNQRPNRCSLNSFRLNGLDQLDAGYRLIRVSGLLDSDEDHDRKLRLLANLVGREVKFPVEPSTVNDCSGLAIVGAKERLSEIEIPAEFALTPDVAELRLDQTIHTLPFRETGDARSRLARRALLAALDGELLAPHSDWWQNLRRFVSRKPTDETAAENVLAYAAFFFTVIPGGDGWFELLIDPSICHLHGSSLYQQYGSSIPNSIKGKRYLYVNGRDYYPITALGVAKSADRELMLDPDTNSSVTIYERLRNRWAGKGIQAIEKLSADAPTIAYKTLTEQNRRAHSELLFELVGTRDLDEDEGSLHSELIMPPAVRARRSEYLISEIESYLKVFGKRLSPARSLRQLGRAETISFQPPKLRFAGDQEITNDLQRANSDRISALRSIGPADSSPFADSQFFIRPVSMPQGVWNDFCAKFALQVQDLYGHAPNASHLAFEKSYGLRLQARALEKAIGDRHGCGLVVLPVMQDNERKTKLHHHLKRTYWSQFHTQCADVETIMSFYGRSRANGREEWFVRNEDHKLYRSYLRNLAFGYLLVNRKWLWKLGRGSLRTQVHIGIDVFKGMAVFTFIYGDADLITFKTSRAVRQEKLSSQQIHEILLENLGADLAQLDLRAASFTFHRDGKFFPSEIRGIKNTLRELHDLYRLIPDVYKLNLVELHKTSAVRPRIYQNVANGLGNPEMGLFAKLSAREGVITTTGYPMLRKGTARPLYFEVIEGDANITDIAHDIYALSHLAFSAPSSCLRLPFTIALADYVLRESTPGDDKPLEDWEESESEPQYRIQKGGA
jgi:hypothetical protein